METRDFLLSWNAPVADAASELANHLDNKYYVKYYPMSAIACSIGTYDNPNAAATLSYVT